MDVGRLAGAHLLQGQMVDGGWQQSEALTGELGLGEKLELELEPGGDAEWPDKESEISKARGRRLTNEGPEPWTSLNSRSYLTARSHEAVRCEWRKLARLRK